VVGVRVIFDSGEPIVGVKVEVDSEGASGVRDGMNGVSVGSIRDVGVSVGAGVTSVGRTRVGVIIVGFAGVTVVGRRVGTV
jgi:hypothetical protein